MVDAIQAHIGSLNWGYRVALREKQVTYLNAFAEFVDPHTIKVLIFVKSNLYFGFIMCYYLDNRQEKERDHHHC